MEDSHERKDIRSRTSIIKSLRWCDKQGQSRFQRNPFRNRKISCIHPIRVVYRRRMGLPADSVLPTYYKQLEALGFDKKDLKYNHTSKHLSVQGFNDHLRYIKRKMQEKERYRIDWSEEAKRLYIVSPFDRGLLQSSERLNLEACSIPP